MVSKFHDWWSTLANFGSDQLATIAKGLYYATETPIEGLKIITINSNYW